MGKAGPWCTAPRAFSAFNRALLETFCHQKQTITSTTTRSGPWDCYLHILVTGHHLTSAVIFTLCTYPYLVQLLLSEVKMKTENMKRMIQRKLHKVKQNQVQTKTSTTDYLEIIMSLMHENFLYRETDMFSLSIENPNQRRWAQLIGQGGACFNSNILTLLPRLVADK